MIALPRRRARGRRGVGSFAIAAALLAASLMGTGAQAWDRFEALPGAARVRQAQRDSRNLFERGAIAVRFSPDGSAVAWRDGDAWRTAPLPKDGGAFDPAAATVLPEAPDWPAWTPPTPRFAEPPPAPPAPGRGLQARSANAPDGKRVAKFVDGNVVITGPDGEVKVTTEGGGAIRYGSASWVYGEELDQSTAMWWSPDGRYLAYYRFDDTPVKSVPMLVDQTSVRPTVEALPYPKPGEPNPIAGLEIYDTQTKERVTVEVGPDRDQYVYWVRWTPDGSALMFNRTNRRQNLLEVMLADPRTGASRPLITERQETWQENHPGLRFLSDGRRFIWESERSGFRQYELWDLEKGRLAELTRGDFPVASIVRVDEERGTLWYTAYGSETRINPQLFTADLDGSGGRRLTPRDRHYSSFTISPDGRWFTATEQFVDLAPALLLFETGSSGTAVGSSSSSPGAAASGAAPAREAGVLRARDEKAWTSQGLQPPELFTCMAADGVTPLYGVLHKPRDFDPSKKYPLLIDVYGGPGIQTVSSRAAAPDARTEFGLLIAKVDNRGTPGRGKAFEGATYLKLGGPDIDDQAAAAKFLASRPFVDGSRVGITGHSYGGYATIMALLRHPEVFSVGVAGAGVTDWRQYDTIYTERYLRTPQENAKGYDEGSAVKLAERLKGRLLLLHGLVDDNVHATNTWALANELQRANIPFEMMIFPESDHGVHGPAAEGVKWSFLLKHLGLMERSAESPSVESGAASPRPPRGGDRAPRRATERTAP